LKLRSLRSQVKKVS